MSADQVKNRILLRLPPAELTYFMNKADLVLMDIKDGVIEPNKPIQFVDFVESGLHSILSVVDHEQVEVATVGYEGMVGIPIVLGSPTSITRVFCQVSGSSWRIGSEDFKEALRQCPELNRLCLRYSFSVMEQASQNSACNRLHTIEERCAKWLLLTHDRMESNSFDLTQEFLAQMLGVRRGSVSLVAGVLQQAGTIRYTRGHIEILDRQTLEHVSCECYAIIKQSLFSFQSSESLAHSRPN